MRLAIVGSTKFVHPDSLQLSREIILHTLEIYEPELVISGGAIGIDTLARFCAEGMEIPVKEHLPNNKRWEPDGYKARNILIAEDCTHLLALRCHQSRTYGSGFTADHAEKLGRKVTRIIL